MTTPAPAPPDATQAQIQASQQQSMRDYQQRQQQAAAAERQRSARDMQLFRALTKGGPRGTPPILTVLFIGAGGYLMWFAVKYWRGTGAAVWPSYPIKSILQGKGLPAPQPATSADVELASWEQSAGAMGGNAAGSASGGAIAQAAIGYIGTPYVWAAADPPKEADCSGLVNAIIGRDLGQPIPGGAYVAGQHGPDVASWLAWQGCTRIAQPAPGVLACWGPNEHMGVCVSSTEMVSALNPALGTRKTLINTAHAGVPTFLLYGGAAATAGGSASENAFWGTFLKAIRAPDTDANRTALDNWAHLEEPSWPPPTSWTWNPLNFTTSSGTFASFGTPQAGALGLAGFMLRGNYSGIIDSLRTGRGIEQNPQTEAELSAWSGGGYSTV